MTYISYGVSPVLLPVRSSMPSSQARSRSQSFPRKPRYLHRVHRARVLRRIVSMSLPVRKTAISTLLTKTREHVCKRLRATQTPLLTCAAIHGTQSSLLLVPAPYSGLTDRKNNDSRRTWTRGGPMTWTWSEWPPRLPSKDGKIEQNNVSSASVLQPGGY